MLLEAIHNDPKVNKQYRIPQSMADKMEAYGRYYEEVHGVKISEGDLANLIFDFFFAKDKTFARWLKKEEKAAAAKPAAVDAQESSAETDGKTSERSGSEGFQNVARSA